jgi:hypothetical protein
MQATFSSATLDATSEDSSVLGKGERMSKLDAARCHTAFRKIEEPLVAGFLGYWLVPA